jgi:UDP-N-acetyl-D-mannosaminuronic acid dehydrogenase
MDVYEVIRIANKHPRVNILQPGPGVGGHCISVDPWFLVGDFPKEAQLIRQAREVNSNMPRFVLGRIDEIMGKEGISDFGRVGIYGLTYKEDVDDCRESPTLQLLQAQERHLGVPLKVYDPYVEKDLVPNQYHDLDAFLSDVDLVVVMVGHRQIVEAQEKLAGKTVLDCRHVLSLPGVHQL